jgi:hypothetical protein
MRKGKGDADMKNSRRKDGGGKPAKSMTRLGSDTTDPQGSYTGRPADPREKPVQDADDL